MSENGSVDPVALPEGDSSMSTAEEIAKLQTEIDALEASARSEDEKFTERQRAFVREYMLDLNATQAAIRAGYSSNGAGVIGARLLSYPHVRARVDKALADRNSKIQLSHDAVVAEMATLAMSSVDHYYIDDEGQVRLSDGAPSNAMAAIQSIKKKTRVHYGKDGEITGKDYDVEIRLWDKPNPLRLMGRHVGVKAFYDRVEVTGKDGEPIVAKIIREVVDAKPDSHS